MIYFLLPKTHIHTFRSLELHATNEPPSAYISNSLSYYLMDIKDNITLYEKDWDIYKKYTNPYEYIHTAIPNKKRSVSTCKPLSRSYFKMIEIVNTFRVLDFVYETPNKINILRAKHDPIKSFHLAEGPGGFIEALAELRSNPNDTYTGMTIIDGDNNDFNVPGWKKSKSFIDSCPNFRVENGKTGDGNILNLENFEYCKNTYASSMDLITADGGFDFSMEFNNQEISITRLLFAQIAYAICMQKKDGVFILKIFDAFMHHTVDLLALLSSFYSKTYITKPQTSRYANSEKYIVCKGFLFKNCAEFYPFIHNAFASMMDLPETSPLYIHRFLNMPLSCFFLSKIEEYNSIFGQQQIDNIYYTLSLVETKNKTEKIDALIRTNIQKCINWCVKNNVPYSPITTNTNVFLSGSSSNNSFSEFI